MQEVVATVRQAQAPGQTFGQPPRVQFGAPDISEHASSQTTPPTKNELVPVDQLARAPARLAKAVDSEGPFIRHKIKDGDTLAGLAEKFLGNPARSDEIYQINGELLRFGPGVLPIGEELLIPAQ